MTIPERVQAFVANALALNVEKRESLTSLEEALTIPSWEKARELSDAEQTALYAGWAVSTVQTALNKLYCPALRAAGIEQPFTHIMVSGSPKAGYMRVIPPFRKQVREDNEAALNKKLEKPCLVYPTALTLFTCARSLLESANWKEVMAGLLVLTGRREIEIVKRATFVPHPTKTYFLQYVGQAKVRSVERKDETHTIPVFAPAVLVAQAITRLRAMEAFPGDETKLHNHIATPLGRVTKAIFNQYFNTSLDNIVTSIHPHSLRAIYAVYAHYWFSPETTFIWFLNHVLGHRQGALASSVYYMQFDAYPQVTRDDSLNREELTS